MYLAKEFKNLKIVKERKCENSFDRVCLSEVL